MDKIIVAVLQLLSTYSSFPHGSGMKIDPQQPVPEQVVVNTYIVSTEPLGVIGVERNGVIDFPGGPITVKTASGLQDNLSVFISSAAAYLKNQTGLMLSTTSATATHIEVKTINDGFVAYFSVPVTGKMTAGQIITKESVPKNFSDFNKLNLDWALDGFPTQETNDPPMLVELKKKMAADSARRYLEDSASSEIIEIRKDLKLSKPSKIALVKSDPRVYVVFFKSTVKRVKGTPKLRSLSVKVDAKTMNVVGTEKNY